MRPDVEAVLREFGIDPAVTLRSAEQLVERYGGQIVEWYGETAALAMEEARLLRAGSEAMAASIIEYRRASAVVATTPDSLHIEYEHRIQVLTQQRNAAHDELDRLRSLLWRHWTATR